MTEFQKKILDYVRTAPNFMASTWVIAQEVFPEKWKHKAGRGALIGHIDRASMKLGELGLTGRLPPKDQWGHAIIFARR